MILILIKHLKYFFCTTLSYKIYKSTTGTNESYYLLFQSNDYDTYDFWWGGSSYGSVDRSTLKSPKINGYIRQCLEFWFV